MTYAEKLKDPRWQKKRLEILERDEWRCRLCGAEDMPLHIHHEKYTTRNPWEEEDINLSAICEKCHDSQTIVTLLKLCEESGVHFETYTLVKTVYDKSNKNNIDLDRKISLLLQKNREIFLKHLKESNIRKEVFKRV